jgi:hypothetical protein
MILNSPLCGPDGNAILRYGTKPPVITCLRLDVDGTLEEYIAPFNRLDKRNGGQKKTRLGRVGNLQPG